MPTTRNSKLAAISPGTGVGSRRWQLPSSWCAWRVKRPSKIGITRLSLRRELLADPGTC
jgi:hypothetical protein